MCASAVVDGGEEVSRTTVVGHHIVGGSHGVSFEDSLFKGWEGLEHFGEEGTVLDEEGGEEEEVEESKIVEDKEKKVDGEVKEAAEAAELDGDVAQFSSERDIDELDVDEEEEFDSKKEVRRTVSWQDSSDEGVGGSEAKVLSTSEAILATEEADGSVVLDGRVVEEGAVGQKKKKKKPQKRKAKKSKDPEARLTMLTMAEIHAAEVWDPNPHWFFLQVKPGCEQSCSISIRNMAMSLEHVDIREVLVPTIITMRLTKSHKSVKKEERLFPGYVLVNMVMDRVTYNDVRLVTNIQWFMNDPNRDKSKDSPFRPPIPVSADEMRGIFEKVSEAEAALPEGKTDFRPGDLIRVLNGPYQDSEGLVAEIKPDVDVIIATLVVFGREAKVELQFAQVELVKPATELNPPKKRGRKSKADLEAEAEAAAISDIPPPVMIPIMGGDPGEEYFEDEGFYEAGQLDDFPEGGDDVGFEEAL